jgi:NAD(P)-dependent dehydrogenase (short-subunit alcohol dehydrogenase family)
MGQRLAGKRAIVTGAGQGIGEAIARVFAAQGATVFIGERNPATGAAVVASIVASGGKAQLVETDVTDKAQVLRLVEAAQADMDGVDPAAERKRAEDIHPPRRIGRPEEVANTALFLASDEAPFINAETIVIDGGRSALYHD